MSRLAERFQGDQVFGIDVRFKPYRLEWHGPDAHLAPSGATPLEDRMLYKTNCAHMTLIAACLIIVARRLADVPHCIMAYHMADALLCFEADPRYVKRKFTKQFPENLTPEQEAIRTICVRSTMVFREEPGEHSNFPPIQALKDAVSITKQVLGEAHTDAFRDWLGDAIKRLDVLAPNPGQLFTTLSDHGSLAEFEAVIRMNHGQPVPIEAVDPTIDSTALNLPALYDDYLRSVDWASNPFLSDPKEMLRAGFEGSPYRDA